MQISLVCVGSAHGVWITLGLPPLTACVLFRSTLLRLQVALPGNCLKWALACVHFPDLRRSGSGSRVLHTGTGSVGPAFCARPKYEQLRRPGAWQEYSSQPLGALGAQLRLRCAVVSSGALISGCNPPDECQLSRVPGRLG